MMQQEVNLEEKFPGEEPLHGVHSEKLGDKLHSALAANLADQVDSVPLVPTVLAQGLHAVQESLGPAQTRALRF